MSVQDIPRLSGLLAAALGDWVDQTGVPPGSGGRGFLGGPGAGASRGSGEPRITGEWDVGVLGAGSGARMGSATGAVPAGAGTQAVEAGLSVQRRIRLSRPVLKLRGMQDRRRRSG
jgi:hypothetical protein